MLLLPPVNSCTPYFGLGDVAYAAYGVPRVGKRYINALLDCPKRGAWATEWREVVLLDLGDLGLALTLRRNGVGWGLAEGKMSSCNAWDIGSTLVSAGEVCSRRGEVR